MTTQPVFPLMLLLFALFFQNCAGDNKQAPQRSSPVTTEQPATNEPSTKQENPAGTSVETLRENKKNRIGTVPTGKDAELNTTIPAPPTKIESKPVKRAGPPGYITRKDAILQTDPTQNAATISTLKQYEIVYIIETIMTDEQGRPAEYPTWYKVERENKQRGWVAAKAVNAGAGG